MKIRLFSINKLLYSQISNKFLCVHNKSRDTLFCFRSDCMIPLIRKSLLTQDMIREFKDSNIIDKKLKLVMTLNGKKSRFWDNFWGVLRDIFSPFWVSFLRATRLGIQRWFRICATNLEQQNGPRSK